MHVIIGHNLSYGGERAVAIPRQKHKLIIGATGVGKSTLLAALIAGDIDAGDGVTVVDPHGSLVDEIVSRIPKHRTNDVIWFDPLDARVIGLNPLDGNNKVLRLEQTLKIISTIWGQHAWGPQSDFIVRNAGQAIIEVEPRPTLLHIYKFFIDASYRNRLFSRVKSPNLRSFYTKIDEDWDARQRESALAPGMNKVDSFISNPVLRHTVCQQGSLDIGKAMNDRKIILCRFSKGALGPEAGSFLGSVLVSKILFAALEREAQAERPFHGVYIDEFHNLTRGNSPEYILSETRKYNVGLTLADQTIAQLPEGSEDAIFGNVSTIIAGRLGAKDAERVSREIGLESPKILQDLSNYRWYVRTINERGDVYGPLYTVSVPQHVTPGTFQSKQKVLWKSRSHWGTTPAQIDNQIDDVLAA